MKNPLKVRCPKCAIAADNRCRDGLTARSESHVERFMEAGALPRCPVCGHLLRFDGAEGFICSARGGCDSEWDVDTLNAE